MTTHDDDDSRLMESGVDKSGNGPSEDESLEDGAFYSPTENRPLNLTEIL